VSAPWITFRPGLKVLDATIRDGGLINRHVFDDDIVRAVYEANVAAGIDYMEIGYKASKRLFARDAFGDWKFCDEEHIRRIVGENRTALRMAAMVDAEKTDFHTDVLPKEKSVLDVIRIATYIHQLPTAVDMIKDAHDKGYETTCNIMAISASQEIEIDQALDVLAQTPVDTIVVVDSFGALYAEQIEILVKKYMRAIDGSGKTVGIHAHNNQQLGFANTIEAIIHGADRADATYGGLGRGAGNCPMELLIGFLRNPKFKIRPIWQLLQDHFVELQKRMEWGPYAQYIITGQHNEHPRSAINARAGNDRDKYVEFYDTIVVDF
jgi:4-hydroxy 2-oxovalerate aldolase